MRASAKDLVPALMTQPLLFISPKLATNSINPSLPAPLRPPPSYASRSTVTMSNNQNDNIQDLQRQQQDQLEAIFKEKRVLRSKVRKTLKAMNPSLRSHEGKAHYLSF